MHKWLMEKGKCLKTEMENKGIDNLSLQDLEEAYYFSKVLRNLMCVEKDGKIVEAMDEAENNDEIMSRIEMYEDYPERRYYDNYRYKTSGRFAPKGKGSYMSRRGYDEPPYYHMNPDMYREHTPEYYRDMDRESGRLYFSEPITMESRYDKAKRMYTETKANHNSGSVEDKQLTLKEGERMLNVIIDELMEMVSDATPEMKNMIKTKGMSAMQKIN